MNFRLYLRPRQGASSHTLDQIQQRFNFDCPELSALLQKRTMNRLRTGDFKNIAQNLALNPLHLRNSGLMQQGEQQIGYLEEERGLFGISGGRGLLLFAAKIRRAPCIQESGPKRRIHPRLIRHKGLRPE